jgi:hypothetical protein
MKYTQLTPEYKFDVIADAVYAREMEYFHYAFDKTNFEHLLQALPDGEYRTNVEQRLADTVKQMASVDAIYAALMSQVDDQAAYAQAVERAKTRREEKKE